MAAKRTGQPCRGSHCLNLLGVHNVGNCLAKYFHACSVEIRFIKSLSFHRIWFAFWYTTGMMFFEDVELAVWALGTYALPVPLIIIVIADVYATKAGCSKRRAYLIFSCITVLILLVPPVWLVIARFLGPITYEIF